MSGAGEATVLDARGLLCPLPVLRARKRLQAMAPGAVLRIEATDPGSVRDMAAFCAATGHRLRKTSEKEGVFVFEIERAS